MQVTNKEVFLKEFLIPTQDTRFFIVKKDFIAYKKTSEKEENNEKLLNDRECITTLLIPKGSEIHIGRFFQSNTFEPNLHNMKCRSEKAIVLNNECGEKVLGYFESLFRTYKNIEKVNQVDSKWGYILKYNINETVLPHEFLSYKNVKNDNPLKDLTCKPGIHWFLSRKHAEMY